MQINIGYNTLIVNVPNAKLLETVIDETFPRKIHLKQIIPKLSAACYELGSPSMSQETLLKMVYYSYFHSIMKYRLILWWKSPNSVKICRIEK